MFGAVHRGVKDPEPFFCNICGGPSTSARLIKASDSEREDPEEDANIENDSDNSDDPDEFDEDLDEEHEFYPDYCDCKARGHPVCIPVRFSQWKS